jgi:hypothetical protein
MHNNWSTESEWIIIVLLASDYEGKAQQSSFGTEEERIGGIWLTFKQKLATLRSRLGHGQEFFQLSGLHEGDCTVRQT